MASIVLMELKHLYSLLTLFKFLMKIQLTMTTDRKIDTTLNRSPFLWSI